MIRMTNRYGKPIEFSTIKFSGGELHPRIEGCVTKDAWIRADLFNSDDIMELLLLTSALRYLKCDHIHLVCPYLPYARQDRVAYLGEALGIKTMCSLVNQMQFASVEVWDVHSDVSMALLDSVAFNRPQLEFVSRISDVAIANCVLVAPDAGARKKTQKAAEHLGLSMVGADKIRSTEDGSITGTEVHSDHIGDKDFLIVDDICDGGRTFVELAKVLRPLTSGKIRLYVTHGIFSKGLGVFDGLIDAIYTPNPWPTVDKEDLRLTIL